MTDLADDSGTHKVPLRNIGPLALGMTPEQVADKIKALSGTFKMVSKVAPSGARATFNSTALYEYIDLEFGDCAMGKNVLGRAHVRYNAFLPNAAERFSQVVQKHFEHYGEPKTGIFLDPTNRPITDIALEGRDGFTFYAVWESDDAWAIVRNSVVTGAVEFPICRLEKDVVLPSWQEKSKILAGLLEIVRRAEAPDPAEVSDNQF